MAMKPRSVPQMLEDPTSISTPSPVGSSSSTTAGPFSVLRTPLMRGSLSSVTDVGMCTATLLVDPMNAGEADIRAAGEAAVAAGFSDASVWGMQLDALSGLDLRVAVVEAAMAWAGTDAAAADAEVEQFAALVAAHGATKVLACTMDSVVPDFGAAQ